MNDLLIQIYASELDHLEIQKRADALSSLGKLSKEQQAELDDYNRGLKHNRGLIDKWMITLKKQGITTLDSTERQAVLDKQILKEQGDKVEVQSVASKSEAPDPDLIKQIAEKDNRVAILNELKARATIWQL